MNVMSIHDDNVYCPINVVSSNHSNDKNMVDEELPENDDFDLGFKFSNHSRKGEEMLDLSIGLGDEDFLLSDATMLNPQPEHVGSHTQDNHIVSTKNHPEASYNDDDIIGLSRDVFDEDDTTGSHDDSDGSEDAIFMASHDIFSLSGDDKDDDDHHHHHDSTFLEPPEGEEKLPEHLRADHLEDITKQLDNLTMKETEAAQLALHGVARPIPESPEQTSRALAEFQHHLDHVLEHHQYHGGQDGFETYRIYNVAKSQNISFVEDRKFRIMFLRSTLWDTKTAATNFLWFFKHKSEIWGEDKLTKKISLEDLSPTDQETLQNGHIQLFPVRDAAGRSILLNAPCFCKFQEDDNPLRVMWYLTMCALEDEETQINGLVVLWYFAGKTTGQKPSRHNAWKAFSVFQKFPFRPCLHACFQKQYLPFVWIIRYMFQDGIKLGRRLGFGFRVHEGSNVECMQQLGTFGIPRFSIPVTDDGELKREYHHEWIQKRKSLEELRAKASISPPTTTSSSDVDTTSAEQPEAVVSGGLVVVVPSKYDVLLGRGKRSQQHLGNIRCNLKMESKFAEYDALTKRAEKRRMAVSIIDELRSDPSGAGRFLKINPNHGMWEVVDDTVAMNKIIHDFRTLRQKKSKVNAAATSSSPEKKKRTNDSGSKATASKRLLQ